MGALELHRRFDAPSDRINLASRDKPVSVSDTVIREGMYLGDK